MCAGRRLEFASFRGFCYCMFGLSLLFRVRRCSSVLVLHYLIKSVLNESLRIGCLSHHVLLGPGVQRRAAIDNIACNQCSCRLNIISTVSDCDVSAGR